MLYQLFLFHFCHNLVYLYIGIGISTFYIQRCCHVSQKNEKKQAVHSYRDKETKKTRSKIIKSLGYLDELEKQYADPIVFFENEIKQMNKEREEERASISINIEKGTRIEPKETNRKNLGYAALSYHELGIHTFLKNGQRHTKSDYEANNIMKFALSRFQKKLLPIFFYQKVTAIVHSQINLYNI